MTRVRETCVDVADGYRLWVETTGDPARPALLLVMGANSSGLGWPDDLVERLSRHHWVIRYDHRDTGRSTHAFHDRPYPIRSLADDAMAVLDALGISRAHVVGMSMGGTLVQLLLLDHPGRLLSATVFGSALIGGGEEPGAEELPGPDPRLLELWEELGQERDEEAELQWRIRHWRMLNGDVLPFDPEEFAALERRIAAHSGTWHSPAAHALADQSGMERGAELAEVSVPTLVIDAPEDPITPPPHADERGRRLEFAGWSGRFGLPAGQAIHMQGRHHT
ncbi:alpha/beta hydrolase, partial [Nonomuraea terrae]